MNKEQNVQVPSVSQHSSNEMLAAVLANVLKMSNTERYMRTIELAVKEKQNTLTALEFIELNACVAQNAIVQKHCR